MNSKIKEENIIKEKNIKSEMKANWSEISGKIKKTFPNISERDLQFMAQGENELIGRLQMKSGKTKMQIRNWIQSSKIL